MAAGFLHELRSYDGGHKSDLSERIGTYMLPYLSERLSVVAIPSRIAPERQDSIVGKAGAANVAAL